MQLRRAIRNFYKETLIQYSYLKGFLGQGSLPEFIIIGVQKGGTTSLYRYLKKHPQILGSSIKELQFFSTNYDKGIWWYRGCFPSSMQRNLRSWRINNKPVIAGEASPYYIFHPIAPRLIAEVLPEVKLIALLRNPIDRLISHYHHMVKIGRENLPIQEAIEREEERLLGEYQKILASETRSVYNYATFSYLARGRYVEQLERYTKIFSAESNAYSKKRKFFSKYAG